MNRIVAIRGEDQKPRLLTWQWKLNTFLRRIWESTDIPKISTRVVSDTEFAQITQMTIEERRKVAQSILDNKWLWL